MDRKGTMRLILSSAPYALPLCSIQHSKIWERVEIKLRAKFIDRGVRGFDRQRLTGYADRCGRKSQQVVAIATLPGPMFVLGTGGMPGLGYLMQKGFKI